MGDLYLHNSLYSSIIRQVFSNFSVQQSFYIIDDDDYDNYDDDDNGDDDNVDGFPMLTLSKRPIIANHDIEHLKTRAERCSVYQATLCLTSMQSPIRWHQF